MSACKRVFVQGRACAPSNVAALCRYRHSENPRCFSISRSGCSESPLRDIFLPKSLPRFRRLSLSQEGSRLASTRRGGLEDSSKQQTESPPRGIFTGIRLCPIIKFLSFAQHQRLATCMLGRRRLESSSASACSGRTYLVGAVGPGRTVQHHLHGRAFGRSWGQAMGVDMDDLDIDKDLVLLELRMTECTSSVPPLRTGVVLTKMNAIFHLDGDGDSFQFQ